jgi:hypothetical protein
MTVNIYIADCLRRPAVSMAAGPGMPAPQIKNRRMFAACLGAMRETSTMPAECDNTSRCGVLPAQRETIASVAARRTRPFARERYERGGVAAPRRSFGVWPSISKATTRTPCAKHFSASKANTAPEHPPGEHSRVGIGSSCARAACWYSTMGSPATDAEMIRAWISIESIPSAAWNQHAQASRRI